MPKKVGPPHKNRLDPLLMLYNNKSEKSYKCLDTHVVVEKKTQKVVDKFLSAAENKLMLQGARLLFIYFIFLKVYLEN